MPPESLVSAAERVAYERDGIVCLRGRFSKDWLDFLAGAIEEAMAHPGPHAEEYTPKGGSGRFFGDLELFERLPKFRRFALESPAARIAGEVMGATRVNFFYDQLLVKEPGTAERTPWHQDQPYWAVSGYQVCSVWLSLDPVPEDVCVEYVCGSHRWPEFSPYHFADGTPYAGTGLPPLPDVEANRGKYPHRAPCAGAGRLPGVPGDDRARRARQPRRAAPSRAIDALGGRRCALLRAAGRGGDPYAGSRPCSRSTARLRALSARLEGLTQEHGYRA